ncbi:SDR family oxidoreductase [Stutzerimonas stutzeri]|uniref:UDP-glucose 4-epimerase family protein n=1 Tax=Stutzerimonas stutzeri TaxID=316 RepID=UPI00300ECCB2
MTADCRVMVTGANGFVGYRLMHAFRRHSHVIGVPCVRRSSSAESVAPGSVLVGDLGALTDWTEALRGVQVVIHIAARAHVRNEEAPDPLVEYRNVNVYGTLNLAKQAAGAGAERFIFISSIGVNGSSSTQPFTAADQPDPAEPYALSKWEAEQGLWQIQRETGMEVVIIRPPLVYGPRAPGNFGSLVRWIEKGIPLPLGAIDNKRSLVGIDNLIDLIIRCIDHPAAANQVFLAGDGEDLSTTELLTGVGKAMGKPARLIKVPAEVLQLGATLLGKKAMAQRLLGSLQVDISKTCEILDWKPPYTVEEGLRRCFEPFD